MADDGPTISLEVHKIYRADFIAFTLTIRNDTERVLPAGVRVEVRAKLGTLEKPWFTVTTPEPLEPGESHRGSSSGPAAKEEFDMEFVARLAE